MPRPGEPGFLPGLVSWEAVRERVSGVGEARQDAAHLSCAGGDGRA